MVSELITAGDGKAGKRTYGGASAEARRLARRSKLLDAAKKLFSEHGFHATTVKAICEAAGLTERYFYESFANNEALFVAMHRRTSDHIIDVLREASHAAQALDQDRVEAILEAYYADIQNDPVATRLFAVDAAYISPTAKEVCASWRAAFGQLLVDAQSRSSNVPDYLARGGVVRALLGLGVDWMEDGFGTPRRKVVAVARSLADQLK